MDRGTYIERDGRPAVRFQRRYPHPVERLWAAVTEPGELAHWFPSTVRIEPRAGGTIAFSDDPHVEPSSGTVLMFDPPHRLAFTWGGDELHFELSPVGDSSCELTLINVLQARDTAARNAAGWSVCLAELGKHVSGAVAGGPHSDTAESWRVHYDGYLADGLPSGAHIPA
jgi:uncharacterized protein YndB with AHSA1/START domain